jgi:hypothetical protein
MWIRQRGDPVKRDETVAMMINADQLPGGKWFLKTELFLRSGGGSTGQLERFKRSFRTGSFAGIRKFEKNGEFQYVTLWIVPMASIQDALDDVKDYQLHIISKTRNLKIVSDNTYRDRSISGIQSTYVRELTGIGDRGETQSIYIAGNVGNIVVTFSFSGMIGMWSWIEIGQIVTEHAARIRPIIGGETGSSRISEE